MMSSIITAKKYCEVNLGANPESGVRSHEFFAAVFSN